MAQLTLKDANPFQASQSLPTSSNPWVSDGLPAGAHGRSRAVPHLSLLVGTVMLDPPGDVVPIQRRCHEMSRPEPASFKSQERNTVLLSSVQLGDGFNGESENNNHQMLRRVIFGESPHRKLEKPH